MAELKAGEKYYTVTINLGVLGTQRFSLFRNPEHTTNPNAPIAKSKYASMWVNTKKDTESIPEDII